MKSARHSTRAIVRREWQRLNQPARGFTDLAGFVPRISPEFSEPAHLRPLVDALEKFPSGSERFCFSVPPRHGKSETLLHAIAFWLSQDPRLRIAYATHTHAFGVKQSKRAKRLARAAGVQIEPGSDRADEWDTPEGGGVVSRGLGGEITGRGFDVVLVDDPIKARAVAESALQRERVFEWLSSDIFSRLTPQGSIGVVHTRWHTDDPIGRLLNEGWAGINLEAVDSSGRPLWPQGGWTLEVLEERRKLVGEYAWSSLYMGQPRPRGGQVFSDPSFFESPPKIGYRVAYGLDLAYTSKTHADYSVAVKMIRHGDFYYLTDLIRKQVDAPSFALALRSFTGREPGRIVWHASGTEKGAAQFLAQRVKRLEVHNASADKFVRAQPLAAAFNHGRVLLPRSAPWLDELISELRDFTGVDDSHDDQVDAIASAFSALQSQGSSLRQLKQGFTASKRRL